MCTKNIHQLLKKVRNENNNKSNTFNKRFISENFTNEFDKLKVNTKNIKSILNYPIYDLEFHLSYY